MIRLVPVLVMVLSALPGPSVRASARSEMAGTSETQAEPPWMFLGLRGLRVARLRLHDDLLYACTENGIYRKPVASTDTLWTAIGPTGRNVGSLWISSPDTLLAAARIPPGDSVSIHRTVDGGVSWTRYQNGFGADRDPEVADFEGLGEPGGVLAVAGSIEKSTNGGGSWRRVAEQCVFNFVRANAAAAGHYWAGGETCIFSPFIMSSSDAGETWRFMAIDAAGDNACDAVAFHPTDSKVIYAGMEGMIQRTLDGGDHWEEVTSPDPSLYFYGIAIRRRLPLRIYAAGAGNVPDPRGVVVYTSDDAGRTWAAHAEPATLRYGVLDLMHVERDGQDWLLVATDGGVYRWSDVVTAVAPRNWSQVKGLYAPGESPGRP